MMTLSGAARLEALAKDIEKAKAGRGHFSVVHFSSREKILRIYTRGEKDAEDLRKAFKDGVPEDTRKQLRIKGDDEVKVEIKVLPFDPPKTDKRRRVTTMVVHSPKEVEAGRRVVMDIHRFCGMEGYKIDIRVRQ